jgi:hypothetical protein
VALLEISGSRWWRFRSRSSFSFWSGGAAQIRGAAMTAAIVTMIAFVCAVNAAIWIDGQAGDANKAVRNILAGLAGGFTGAIIMALGISLCFPQARVMPWRGCRC